MKRPELTDENTPECYIKLAKETIENALADIKQKWSPWERLAALQWFNERSTRVFGYGWCLEYSGYNPNMIRRCIIRHFPSDQVEAIVKRPVNGR